MAEVLGVTASAVGVIGFAGQLSQSAVFCYNFFKDAKDAPKDVEKLIAELGEFATLLQGVAAIYSPRDSPDADLERALRQCEKAIKVVEDALRTVRFPSSLDRGQRWWRKVKAALKRPGLAKHLDCLGRSKYTLVQACMNNSRMATAAHLQVSQDMKARLTTLVQEQADGNDIAFETKIIVSDIEARAAEMHISMDRGTQVLSQVQPRVEAIERMTTELFEQRSLVNGIDLIPADLHLRERLIRGFAEDISKSVVHGIRGYLQKIYVEEQLRNGMPTPPRQCQCNGHESQAVVHTTAGSPIKLSREANILQQTQGTSAKAENQAQQTWRRESRNTTIRYLIRNWLFGTLKVQTTLTVYSRLSLDTKYQERYFRQVWDTTITYTPSFLGSQGMIARYSPWNPVGEVEHFVPAFNVHLQSFHVRDGEDEIFAACRELDISKIHDLFDSGLATPFDVDDGGRSLLGWTVVGGLRVIQSTKSSCPNTSEHLWSSFEQMIDMFLRFGLDSSQIEYRDEDFAQNTVSLYLYERLETYFEERESLLDRSQLILQKLLSKAKSNPFENGNPGSVLLKVDSNGNYTVIEFPTRLYEEYLEVMPIRSLEILTREEEWPIPWDTEEVPYLCSLFFDNGRCDESQSCPCDFFEEHERFWVTSRHGEVEVYLKAKLTLLQRVLTKQRHVTDEQQWATSLLHITIHSGAETIAILKQPTHHDHKPRWVRHRVKKLVLIRKFLIDTIELIMTTWWHKLAAPHIIDQLNDHATWHHLRIVNIWKRGLHKASRNSQRHASETSQFPRQQRTSPQIAAGVLIELSEAESGWETDDSDEYFSAEEGLANNADETESDWETEDEWEEGHMLDKAVDLGCSDDKNTQLYHSQNHPDWCGFDKGDASHVCEEIYIPFCPRRPAGANHAMPNTATSETYRAIRTRRTAK